MVIFIMIDGTRPDALDQTECPNLKGLIQRGSSTMTATSVMPSITLPCHMSIFHSVPPTRHGITANLYLPMARPLPGLVETLRSAGKRSAFVYNWEPLRDLARPENVSYAYYREPKLDVTYDDVVGAEAVRLLQEEQYDFLFIYFGSIDTAGHAYGWMAPEYLQQISRVDGLIGNVLKAMPEDTTIIVQSDHGGHDRSHGTESPEDMTIPWIIAGPSIRQGHTITSPVNLINTAPTIVKLLGVEPNHFWEGTAVDEVFV
jgi:predicted AlkP superfamily pyrophosphatase or phosphodiesterase